jgi:hypothetical protein
MQRVLATVGEEGPLMRVRRVVMRDRAAVVALR